MLSADLVEAIAQRGMSRVEAEEWQAVIQIVLPLVAYICARVLVVGYVQRLMMRKSPDGRSTEGDFEELVTPSNPNGELEWVDNPNDGPVELSPTEEQAFRKATGAIGRQLSYFWGALAILVLAQLLLLLGYDLFVWAYFGHRAGGYLSIMATTALVAVVIGAWATIRCRRVGYLTRWVGFSSLAAASLPLMLATFSRGLVWGLGGLFALGGAIAWLLFGMGRLRRQVIGDGNVQLLVLRVFGVDSSVPAIFGALMRRWRFLGSSMTIVDPAYVRYQFSLSSPEGRDGLYRMLPVYLVGLSLLGLVVYAVAWGMAAVWPRSWFGEWFRLSPESQLGIVTILAWVLSILAVGILVVRAVLKRFLSCEQALEQRLDRFAQTEPAWSGGYASFPTYCYDDLWRKAVGGAVDVADIVLMDLRGFTAERAGCEHELGLLFDRVSMRHVLFLVEPGDAGNVAREAIEAAWLRRDRQGANGRGLTRVQLYSPGPMDGIEVNRLTALMARCARIGQGKASREPVFVCSAFRERLRPLVRFVSDCSRFVPAKLDAMVAKPGVAIVVVPLALVASGVALFAL